MPTLKRTANLILIIPVLLTGLFTLTISNKGYSQIPRLNSHIASRATVFLDFDGHTVKGTSWNWDSTIHAKAAGLSSTVITEIFNRVAEDFRIFNLNITTDPNVYSKAPIAKRVRIILTPTYKWYGSAGGVAFVNSFNWGDETPAWVFTTQLENKPKYIAEATSHEIGHTLGLQHQSSYSKSCQLITEYSEGRGTGEIGWAPIMGVGYYRNFTTWTIGATIEGCKIIQNDIAILSKGENNIGMRTDEYGNARTTAYNLSLINGKFQVNGVINNAPDKDLFKIVLSKKGRLKSSALPGSVGAGNSGANVDLLMTLIKSNGDTIIRANPKTTLGATFDTLLMAGTYYIGIDGINNQNVSDYGSAGFYSLTGTVQTSTTTTVLLKGDVKQNAHLINWSNNPTMPLNKAYLEISFNGIHFLPVAGLPANSSTYTYNPRANGNVYYRVKMILPDQSIDYSNTIMLNNVVSVTLVSNIVHNSVQVKASGNYEYQIFDETGRLYQKGRLTRGLNNVPLNQGKNGLLIMKVFNNTQQFNYKLIKQ